MWVCRQEDDKKDQEGGLIESLVSSLSSATRLYRIVSQDRGQAIVLALTQRQSSGTMTSVSAGHIY